MKDCLFCKIANKEIDSDIVFENANLVVFKDISPASPVHLLLIPKKHVTSIMEIDRLEGPVVQEIMQTIKTMASDFKLDEKGFRIVTNMGPYGGQSVDHLHFHIMGQRKFSWPPG